MIKYTYEKKFLIAWISIVGRHAFKKNGTELMKTMLYGIYAWLIAVFTLESFSPLLNGGRQRRGNKAI